MKIKKKQLQLLRQALMIADLIIAENERIRNHIKYKIEPMDKDFVCVVGHGWSGTWGNSKATTTLNTPYGGDGSKWTYADSKPYGGDGNKWTYSHPKPSCGDGSSYNS